MLTFPKDGSNETTFFSMTPFKFFVSLNTNSAKQSVNRSLDSNNTIILPTPSGGLSLNESGNWEETEGYLDFSAGVLGSVAKKLKETGGSLASHAIKGQFINDYSSLTYQGSNFRSYSFAWDLIPSSETEANDIASIIRKIREFSLPNYSGDLIDFPYMWSVKAANNSQVEMYLQDCVISNFTVNFTPEGVLRTYSSGHPTSVNMEIEFKELYRANRNDVFSINNTVRGL